MRKITFNLGWIRRMDKISFVVSTECVDRQDLQDEQDLVSWIDRIYKMNKMWFRVSTGFTR